MLTEHQLTLLREINIALEEEKRLHGRVFGFDQWIQSLQFIQTSSEEELIVTCKRNDTDRIYTVPADIRMLDIWYEALQLQEGD